MRPSASLLLALLATLGGQACDSDLLARQCIDVGKTCSVSVGTARGLQGCCSKRCGPERVCLPSLDDGGPNDAGPDAARDADAD